MIIYLLPTPETSYEKTKDVVHERFAEQHGEFMFDMMNLDGSSPTYHYIDKDESKRFADVPAGSGLFVLFVTSAEHERPKFPVYVGRTKRTFMERLKQLTFIQEVLETLEDGYRLGISVSKLSLPVAVFMKQFFLEEFSFSLNSKENIPQRVYLDNAPLYQRNESAKQISKKWRECLGEIKNMKETFQVMVYESLHERKLRQEMHTLRQDMQDLQEQIKLINQKLGDKQTEIHDGKKLF